MRKEYGESWGINILWGKRDKKLVELEFHEPRKIIGEPNQTSRIRLARIRESIIDAELVRRESSDSLDSWLYMIGLLNKTFPYLPLSPLAEPRGSGGRRRGGPGAGDRAPGSAPSGCSTRRSLALSHLIAKYLINFNAFTIFLRFPTTI